MRFTEEAFPLIVLQSPRSGWDERNVRALSEAMERVWNRGERYALVASPSSRGAPSSARGRKLLADWANTERVRTMSKEYCVGAAATVASTIARGAVTAILWLWTPPIALRVTAGADEAIEWCIDRLLLADIELQRSPAKIRTIALDFLRSEDPVGRTHPPA